MDSFDNEFERCARELLAYLDSEAEIERGLPFPVGFMVKQMRAAIFAKAMRTLAPAQRCRIYRHCRARRSTTDSPERISEHRVRISELTALTETFLHCPHCTAAGSGHLPILTTRLLQTLGLVHRQLGVHGQFGGVHE